MSEFPPCPECGTKTVAQLDYLYEGKNETTFYCPKHDRWMPPPRGPWSRWNPKPGDYKENS